MKFNEKQLDGVTQIGEKYGKEILLHCARQVALSKFDKDILVTCAKKLDLTNSPQSHSPQGHSPHTLPQKLPKPKTIDLTPDGESYLLVYKQIMPPKANDFNELWITHPDEYHVIKMFGRDVNIPRYQQSYGLSYPYSGKISKSIPMTPLISQLTESMNTLINNEYKFNMCLVNFYEGKHNHYISAHSDDESVMVKDSPIGSISWGYPRDFILKPKKNVEGETVTLKLEEGDVVFMCGTKFLKCEQRKYAKQAIELILP